MGRGEMKKTRSLRFLFNRFVSVSLLLILGLSAISNLQTYSFWRQYKRTFTLFDDLSRFYEETDKMNFRMKSFIYTRDPVEFRASETHLSRAFSALERLKSYKDEELRFRFSLLMNMIATYREKREVLFLTGAEPDAQKAYDSLDRLAWLIEETYPQYARIVTREMNREKERMLALWQKQLYFTIIIFIVYILFVGSFSFLSVSSITRPVEELIVNMNSIKQGVFDINDVESKTLEIGILLESFEGMAEDLKAHIDEIHEKSRIEKELIEKEKILVETRLNALQGQMNPHFLFNTLSLISKMAYVEGAEKTSDLMTRTASLLRYSLDMGGKTSTLKEELVCLENYIKIQEKRVGDRILFNIERKGDIEASEIPGMVLQPLVENAVVHGVKDLIKDGEITIRLIEAGPFVKLEVEDNGGGYPGEILKEFITRKLKSSGIGLSNVRDRLALFYGESCTMELENRPGALTRILIPKTREV